MTELSAETTAEVRDTLDQLLAAQLPAETWADVPGHLGQLSRSLGSGDEHATRAALVPLSRFAFEAKVRARLGGDRAKAAAVVPTKQTPALPVVGAVCGAILLALGWQLGGPLVLAATGGLALLVLVVAVAGMRTSAERTTARRARRESRSREVAERVPAPRHVQELLSDLRGRSELS